MIRSFLGPARGPARAAMGSQAQAAGTMERVDAAVIVGLPPLARLPAQARQSRQVSAEAGVGAQVSGRR
jgi:hypothetical protein